MYFVFYFKCKMDGRSRMACACATEYVNQNGGVELRYPG